MSRFHIRHRGRHAVRHVTHSPHHNTKTARTLKKFLILGVLLLVTISIGVTYALVVPERSAKKENKAIGITEEILDEVATTQSLQTIQSTLGFKLRYDETMLSASGQTTDGSSTSEYVTGMSYDETELKTPRPYSIVKLKARATEAETSQPFSPIMPELSVVTNIRKDYWDNKVGDKTNAGLSKLEIAANSNVVLHQKNPNVIAEPAVDVVIGGTPYKYIVYKTRSEAFGVTHESQEWVYVAVQNDRPYFITISFINDSNANDVALFQSIIQEISYEPIAGDLLSLKEFFLGRVAGVATASDLPKATTKTPYDIKPSTILDVILRNQPAVVRVATLACADIELLLPDQTVGLKLQRACNAGIGSGSIVSSDGYIATNGHVTTIGIPNIVSGYALMSTSREVVLERIQKILRYMVDANIVSEKEVTALLEAASKKDPEAIAVLMSLGTYIPEEYIRASNEERVFAIQTSYEPIQLDTDKAVFSYTKSVIPATFVASNFDETLMERGNYNFGSGLTSDVAILKAKGSFPSVELGSITTLNEGDDLTAIGFPAFTDGGLMTTRSKTPPTVTQGSVLGITAELGSSHKLIFTNVPIARGNSGGPSFNNSGKQVGLNTYSELKCPDLDCFGEGIARDIADYEALLAENKITLNTDSRVSEVWSQGLEAFSEGNYRGAVQLFNKVSDMYPAHYLATSMTELAKSKYGSPADISDGFFTSYNLINIAKILAGLITVAVVFLGGFLIYGSRKHGLVGSVSSAAWMGGTPVQPTYTFGQPVQQNYPLQPVAATSPSTIQQPISTPQQFVATPVVVQPTITAQPIPEMTPQPQKDTEQPPNNTPTKNT
jgi:Trypsin-like peptidase domain